MSIVIPSLDGYRGGAVPALLDSLKLAWIPSLSHDVVAVLATDKVRFQGQEVAFVVAEDRYAARDALALIDVEQPAVGWSDYLDGGKPRWDRITLSGHSNGTNMAALIARDHDVGRVLMFAGPSDKPQGETADWLTDPKVTPIDRYFGFIHVDEGTFFVHSNWENMGRFTKRQTH